MNGAALIGDVAARRLGDAAKHLDVLILERSIARGFVAVVRCRTCEQKMERAFDEFEPPEAVETFFAEVLAAHAHLPETAPAPAPVSSLQAPPIRLAVKKPHEKLGDVAIPILEDLLERARRGELESFLVLFEGADFDGMQWHTAGTLGRSQTIGRIEILKQRMILDLFNEEVDLAGPENGT